MPLPPRQFQGRDTPLETTAVMAANIGPELAEIEQALERCRGDHEAEPRLTGTWMAHLLFGSHALLHSLLIDTARRPRRISTQEP
jgi:hypothetical protein